MRLRALALAGCWLWLASAANAGELRADWPLGGSHGGPLRVEWDGRGELTLISGQPYSSRPSRARRAGPGISWLSNPSYYSYSLASSATLRQTVGRHVVAETALPAVPKLGCCLLWLGQPKLSADDRDRVAGLWCDTAQSRAIAVGQPADILPDRAALLRSLRAVVVEVPLTPAQQQVIADYAFSGGLVVQRAGVAALVAKDAPATALPGRPRLTCSPLGLGGVVTVSGPITADSTLWSRINAADLRAGSPSMTSLLPEGPEMARAMDASKPIHSRYLLAFLLAYLAAIGPLTWLVARAGRGSAARGWLAAPVVAALAVTVAAAWVNANGRRQSAAYQMTNTTLDAGSRYGAARTTLRIATSSATTYTVTPTDRRARFGSAALSTLDDNGQMRVGPWSIPPRSARVLSGTTIIDVGGTVSMDLRRVGSELRGTIRNAMPYALRGAVLCWRDRIRPLG
ncbi:MAG: hypothetical protein HZB16_15960, partial [Armatimonadetes bacterium]|nr:hypothetical protein [Armatimonadota bacterium]